MRKIDLGAIPVLLDVIVFTSIQKLFGVSLLG
jgi:hypothetical protein